VNAALDRALQEAGVETPDPTYDLRLRAIDEVASHLRAENRQGEGMTPTEPGRPCDALLLHQSDIVQRRRPTDGEVIGLV
jgi:hypothetical protein